MVVTLSLTFFAYVGVIYLDSGLRRDLGQIGAGLRNVAQNYAELVICLGPPNRGKLVRFTFSAQCLDLLKKCLQSFGRERASLKCDISILSIINDSDDCALVFILFCTVYGYHLAVRALAARTFLRQAKKCVIFNVS